MDVLHKALALAPEDDPYEFVMSDESVDRMGDVIEQAGWKLNNFTANPIALFGHDSSFPIGNWKNVRVEGGKLRGRLELLAKGFSARIDELRALVEAKMLRAVSVGFKPLDAEALSGSKVGGVRFKKQELVECSLVSVPANPNALAIAKSLHISDDVKRLIFGETADEVSTVLRRGMPGEPAVLPPQIGKAKKMATLSDRIVDAQNDLNRLRDQLTDHVKEDNADEIVTGELADQIEQKEGAIAALKRAESALAAKSGDPENQQETRRPFAQAAKRSESKDLVLRSAVVQVLSHIEKRSPIDILKARYGEDDGIKTMLDVVTKAASAPATTTTTGWAAELVQTATLDFLESLMPLSIYPGLRDRGGRFTFGRNGVVSIPSRAATPTVAGSFVAQGGAIPVRQAAFNATTLTPKKMAVITTFTREISEHSTPAIEAVLRQAIQEDTALAIDTVLMDATAASTTRPAGLRNGVSGLTATTGGGFAALVGDIKGLVGALITSSGGNLRAPVFIMNPVQALSIALTQNAGGDFPFAADIGRGLLQGYPVLQSSTVASGTVMLVDAADFFSASGDEPRFDVSDQATLHMEDTSPTAIATAGTPNVVAAPVRSLWQTDTIGLRMIMDLNWAMRRTGTVAYVTSVTW
jgi:HK97 family phage major capsid protein/HK97 family phage prohead protease